MVDRISTEIRSTMYKAMMLFVATVLRIVHEQCLVWQYWLWSFTFRETEFNIQSNGDKERFDKEQIGVKEPFPVTNCQFTT